MADPPTPAQPNTSRAPRSLAASMAFAKVQAPWRPPDRTHSGRLTSLRHVERNDGHINRWIAALVDVRELAAMAGTQLDLRNVTDLALRVIRLARFDELVEAVITGWAEVRVAPHPEAGAIPDRDAGPDHSAGAAPQGQTPPAGPRPDPRRGRPKQRPQRGRYQLHRPWAVSARRHASMKQGSFALAGLCWPDRHHYYDPIRLPLDPPPLPASRL